MTGRRVPFTNEFGERGVFVFDTEAEAKAYRTRGTLSARHVVVEMENGKTYERED